MRLQLGEAVSYWAKCCQDKPAIIADCTFSYRDVDSAANNIACILSKLKSNVQKHNRVALVIKDKPLLIVAIVACQKAGCVFCPINPDCHLDILGLLTSNCTLLAILTDIHVCFPHENLIGLDRSIFNNCNMYFSGSYLDLYDESAIMFTSGSSGPSKGVVRSGYSLLSEAILWIVELEITKSSIFSTLLPFYYTGGFVFMYSTIFCGGTLLALDGDNYPYILQKCVNSGCTHYFFIPSHIYEILRKCKNRINLSDAKVLVMGSPIDARSKQDFAKRYNVRLRESWGNSEGLGTITEYNDLKYKSDSIGHPCFCDAVVVVDDHFNEMPVGQVGLLAGYSDNQLLKYVDESESYQRSGEKLIISDDLGRIDQDGYVYILGRKSEVVSLGSEIFYCGQIEKSIMSIADISDCAIVISNNKSSASITVFLVSDSSIDEDSINKILDQHISIPYSFVVRYLREIPRNRGGKVIRNQLISI